MKPLPSPSQPDCSVEQTFHCIDCGDGSAASPLWLTDVSAQGARLTGRDVANMPDTFRLRVQGHGNGMWRCRVAWRKRNEIGVTIIETLSADDGSTQRLLPTT